MARYYFHVRDGETRRLDPEGEEFDNPDVARQEAIKDAREIIAQKILAGETVDGQRFELTAEDGTIVDVIPFRSVLKLDD